MNRKIFRHNGSTLEYFIKGKNPKILIDSGMHGDEYRIINIVGMSIQKYSKNLPDFIFIPKMSPSGIKMKTRINGEKADLNRSFFRSTSVDEAQTIMSFLLKKRFSTVISFHEDLGVGYFYLYSSHNLEGSFFLENIRTEIRGLGINLLNGIDDPEDPDLGNLFEEGFCHTPLPPKNKTPRSFEDWVIKKGITKLALLPEIPSEVTTLEKEKLVDIIFENFIGAEERRGENAWKDKHIFV